MNEHGKRENEPMFKHLSECEMLKETCNLHALPSFGSQLYLVTAVVFRSLLY